MSALGLDCLCKHCDFDAREILKTLAITTPAPAMLQADSTGCQTTNEAMSPMRAVVDFLAPSSVADSPVYSGSPFSPGRGNAPFPLAVGVADIQVVEAGRSVE
jgi:hypothetical protein